MNEGQPPGLDKTHTAVKEIKHVINIISTNHSKYNSPLDSNLVIRTEISSTVFWP